MWLVDCGAQLVSLWLRWANLESPLRCEFRVDCRFCEPRIEPGALSRRGRWERDEKGDQVVEYDWI